MIQKDAVTLLSGGRDSATLLYWANANGYKQEALFIDYGQSSSPRDLKSARANAKALDLNLRVIDLSSFNNDVMSLAQTYFAAGGDPLLSDKVGSEISDSFAEAMLQELGFLGKTDHLLIGLHRDDIQRFPRFAEGLLRIQDAINQFIDVSGGSKLQIEIPFRDLSRSGVIKLGKRLGVRFENTWSCHLNYDRPCLECPSCIERKTAFDESSIDDPLIKLH